VVYQEAALAVVIHLKKETKVGISSAVSASDGWESVDHGLDWQAEDSEVISKHIAYQRECSRRQKFWILETICALNRGQIPSCTGSGEQRARVSITCRALKCIKSYHPKLRLLDNQVV
jgi:hypothetical protein